MNCQLWREQSNWPRFGFARWKCAQPLGHDGPCKDIDGTMALDWRPANAWLSGEARVQADAEDDARMSRCIAATYRPDVP